MDAFSRLYRRLDETTKTNEKLAALKDYFRLAPAQDAAWAIHFLSGDKVKRALPTKTLRAWVLLRTGLPEWLFEETYGWVGDLAETLSLLVPATADESEGTLSDWVPQIYRLSSLGAEECYEHLDELWGRLSALDRFVFLKLITGAMRVGVSRRLVTRAIADCFELPPESIAHRLMGSWTPTEEFFQKLIASESSDVATSQPYPFCLAYAIEGEIQTLGAREAFLAEWKWDGIRSQLIRRRGETFLWSRGEERLEDRFPEVVQSAAKLPDDIVLDGELLAWKHNRPLPFGEMQRRIGRKNVSKKILEEVPALFIAFDMLEANGRDLRTLTLQARREILDKSLDCATELDLRVKPSSVIDGSDWETLGRVRDQSREFGAEGLMLKRLDSVYESGRVRGAWWKWKIEPYTIDAVLIYAQRGHGRRASLYTDFTFALWDGEQLVPFAKAYSGLTDEEMRRVDRFVRENTQERFGPVRSVTPSLVMELAFENIQESSRHKSGIAVRFPRIVRWRTDKQPRDANTLEELRRMIRVEPTAS